MDEDERPRSTPARIVRYVSLYTLYLFDRFLIAGADNIRLAVRELGLFLGLGALLMGLLNFESDRYCDGNTSQYLSCTRPSTYYYFDTLDIALIIFGVFAITLWLLKRRG